MRTRRFRRYESGGDLSQYAGYGQLGSQLINTIDPKNAYGVQSDIGAFGSGAMQGASLGLVAGPVGVAVGGAIGGITSLFGNDKRKEEERKAKEQQRQIEINGIMQHSKGVLANYPSYGVMSAKYGMKLPNGGKLPYPTDNSQTDVLASNIAQYSGDTHENGGIPIDTNQDQRPEVEIENNEVIKDDMVLSDRLYPSKLSKSLIKGLGTTIKDSDTYASLSARLGKNKGKFEKNLESTRLGEKGTAQLMVKQLDDAVNTLFKDQQLQKQIKGVDSEGNKMALGGSTDPIKKLWKKIEANPLKTTAADLYKIYDLEYGRDAMQSGTPIELSNDGKPTLKFTDNNLIPQMFTQTKVYNPGAGIGKVNTRVPKYAFGDYIPKVSRGLTNDPSYLNMEESINNLAMPNYSNNPKLTNNPAYINMQNAINELPNLNPTPTSINNGGGTIETLRPEVQITQPEKVPFMETVGNNLGNIANGIGFLANNAQINQLQTEYNPTLTPAPNYNFTSRLPYLSNQVKSAYRTATQGIKGSSAQDNQALQSNMFAKTLSSLNEATGDEFARKDQYDARHNEMVNRNNLYNTNTINQAKFASQDNRNQKVALRQQNVDSLIKGIIGNKTVKDQQELDFAKNYMELLKGDQTGVSKRFLEQVPAKFRRKYIGNYYN